MTTETIQPRAVRQAGCLWERDAATKGHPDPQQLRCRRDGRVRCAPCVTRLRTLVS